MAAWIPAAVLGVLMVNIPDQFEGPLRNVPEGLGLDRLAGVDVSLFVAIALAVLLYLVLLWPSPSRARSTGSASCGRRTLTCRRSRARAPDSARRR